MNKNEILKVTKQDIDSEGFYKEKNLVNDTGGIVVEEDLGWVKVRGYVRAKAGLGIEAGSGIKAGEGIEAGEGIKAGWGVKAGEGVISGLLGTSLGNIVAQFIDVKLRICAGFNVKSECFIDAEVRNGTVILGTVKKSLK